MKILTTTDPCGGVFTYVVDLARALAPHGVETVVAATGGALSAARRQEILGIPGASLYEAPFRLEWMDDPWEDVARAGWWLEGLCRGLRPDVIHLNGYAHAARDLGAPKLVAAHGDLLSWWRAVKEEEAPSRYNRYRDAVRAGLAGADLIVAPTRSHLVDLEACAGPLERARVVPDAMPFRSRLCRPSKEARILGVGRLWEESENLSALDRIAGALDWPVVLAGETGGRLFERVRLLGPLDREALGDWMDRSAVLCHPTLYDPCGRIPLEAAEAGCALVLSDLPALREIWGEAALYVPPRDPAAIAEGLGRVIRDPALREGLVRAARSRVRRLDPEVRAQAMLSLYQQLSFAPRPGRRVAELRSESP